MLNELRGFKFVIILILKLKSYIESLKELNPPRKSLINI